MNYDDNIGKTLLLVGNGFDLSYSLPTSYICFLQTISFILDNRAINYSTVGGVFNALSSQNKTIKDSYEQYKSIYDSCRLEKETLEKIKEKAEHNSWFLYFKNCFETNATWIDFEREIAEVILYFKVFLKKTNTFIHPQKETMLLLNAFSHFNKFFQQQKNVLPRGTLSLVDEYVQNHHVKGRCPNKEKIIQTLLDDLYDFSDILKIYLRFFVDYPVKKGEVLSIHSFLPTIDYVITFNYTNTFEMISPRTEVFHIHGNVDNRIVLGINPNKDDELETIDTSFIQFKKYFQRAFYDIEDEYIEIINSDKLYSNVHGIANKPFLCVFGHSLDVTDKDIIEELFNMANGIQIFYHNEQAKASYIKNIVQIFGKKGYDRLKREKNLKFTPTKQKQ